MIFPLFSGIGNKDLDETCTDVTECQDKHVQCIGAPKKCQCLSSHFSKGGFCRESKFTNLRHYIHTVKPVLSGH